MRQDAWRAYLEMALGVTEASTKKALKTAKNLVGKSGVSAEQLQGMADELVRASAANREAVRNLVRVELERALNVVGLAKADEVETLTARVRELEAQLQASKPATADSGPVPSSLAAPVAKKTVAKKAVAKKAAPDAVDADGQAEIAATTEAAQAARAEVAAEAATAAPAKKTVAKKAVAKKAEPPAKKAVATKAEPPAKKAVKKAGKAAPSAVGEEITAPAPGPAGPEPRGAAPAKKAAKKTTKRTPGSGEPVP